MVGQKTVVLVDMCLDADDRTHRRRARSVWGPAKKMMSLPIGFSAPHQHTCKVEPVWILRTPIRFRFPDWLVLASWRLLEEGVRGNP